MASPTDENGNRPRWSLRLFGELELIELGSGRKISVPGKRERVLLAYLAIHPKCREARRKLTTFLWGEGSDETTLENLRTCVFNLRKALGPTGNQVISSEGREIVLDVSAFEIDALEFWRLAGSSDPARLEQAAQLYGGEFLDGLGIESEEFESWRRTEASRCRDRAVTILASLMSASANAGDAQHAIDIGLRILRLEPLHEPTTRLLMRLYRDSGRRSAAIQLYRDLSDALKRELNTQPESETRKIFAEIATGNEERSPPVAAEMRALSPPAEPGPPLSSARPARRRYPGLALVAGAVLAVAALLYYPVHALFDTTASTSQLTAAPAQTEIKIAVLPFANESGDPKQKLFTDGLTQEITSALAKIPGLSVIGRDSVSRIKSKTPDMQASIKQLGVAYLVHGSIQASGQRLLIAASLTGANGKIVWTQNYDRSITDAFALQQQIAQAIAASLHLPFESGFPASKPAIDPESYKQYLAARPLVRARYVAVEQAIDILEPLVARYPDFAPASALLASEYVYASQAPGAAAVLGAKAEAAARRAIASDPALADGYFALARLKHQRGKLVESDDLLRKALSLDRDDADGLVLQMALFVNVGRVKDALAIAERVRALEPAVPAFSANIGRVLWENGRNTEAIEVLKPVLEFGSVRPALAMIYASMGRYADGADVLEHDGLDLYREQSVQAARILRAAPAKAPATDTDPPLFTRPFPVDFVYLYTGYPERALGSFEEAVKAGTVQFGDLLGLVWHPSYAPARKTERFKKLMRDVGNVDYWHVKGWPEFCHAATGDDFTCH